MNNIKYIVPGGQRIVCACHGCHELSSVRDFAVFFRFVHSLIRFYCYLSFTER